MTPIETPRVFLVGAGPGDPGLLTLRAIECLARADLVVYDKLVPARLLDFANPAAERRCVTELGHIRIHCGASVPPASGPHAGGTPAPQQGDVEAASAGGHSERCTQTMQAVIAAARQGKTVVRLKGGDPLVFGRGSEEAEELRAAGIAYEIVPGVTAALAAGSFAEIPLTHRSAASAVAFVTGHENPAKGGSALDWPALARFPGTLVIYMGMSRLESIAKGLIENGRRADEPAAVVALAGTGQQRKVTATLATLAETVRTAGLAAPAVVFTGPAVGLVPAVSWFESRPLFGKRILVTRPRQQAVDFVRKLELLGAIPVVLPAVEILPPSDWSQVDDHLARLGEYEWLVFTSANGVRSFLGRLRETGRDLRSLVGLQLAAIGPGTAEALRAFHLNADLIPAEFRSESLAAMLAERAVGKRILLARADRGRDVLPVELSKVATVDQIAVYRQVDSTITDPSFHGIDYVTLTSANVARSILRSLDAAGRERVVAGELRLVTISPVTSAAVAEMGYSVAAEAREYTTDGLLAALTGLT